MIVYDYLFYKINYLVSAFDYKTHFASVIIMCWLFIFNCATLTYFLSFRFEIKAIIDIYFSIYGGAITIGGHLLYFLRNSKIERINNKFKNESKASSVAGLLGAILYIGLTIWIFAKVTVPNSGGIVK